MRPPAFRFLSGVVVLSAFQLSCAGDVSPSQTYRIVDLGALQCVGASNSNPACHVGQINDYCEVAGWDVVTTPQSPAARAFVWRPGPAGSVRRLELPRPNLEYVHGPDDGAFQSSGVSASDHFRAYDINNLGEVIGTGTGPRNQAILWVTRPVQTDPNLPSRSARTAYLRFLPNGSGVSGAQSINDEAQMVGSSTTIGGTHAMFFTTYLGMKDVGVLPHSQPHFAEALAVSEGASVAGVSKAQTGNRAFLARLIGTTWMLTDLGDLPGGADDSRANAVSRHDVVAGQSAVANGFHAFRWTLNSQMSDLGDLAGGAEASAAIAIRDTVAPDWRGPFPPADIVGFGSNASGRRAVAWQALASGMSAPIDLNTQISPSNPITILEQAGGINGLGIISAFGRVSGQPRVFLLVPAEADVADAQGVTPFQHYCLGPFAPP